MNSISRYILILSPAIWLIIALSTGCGSADVAFINEVKSFEPRWMELSERFTFVDRNLSVTEARYEADLEQVMAFFDQADGADQNRLNTLKARYDKTIDERNELRKSFDELKGSFKETVVAFNDWDNQLMKNKLPKETAAQEFKDFKSKQQELVAEIENIQGNLIQNIGKHNDQLRQMTRLLEIYTSYDIEAR
ncbi:MAG: hypothetical protein AAGI38_13800 [Bacteroidota bacterium]